MNHEIGSYNDGGIKVTMVSRDPSKAYAQAVERLMCGIRPDADGALAELKEKHPDIVQLRVDELMSDFTLEGIEKFETALRKGFKYINRWASPSNRDS
ncbi:hypothetical protein KAR91_30475 [Candidatus Pacearchaeota archaeon]|nr:hypothetical protein [Candidatus Pacearchaeota archaeon]